MSLIKFFNNISKISCQQNYRSIILLFTLFVITNQAKAEIIENEKDTTTDSLNLEKKSEQIKSPEEEEYIELPPVEVEATSTDALGYTAINASSATKTDTPIMEIPQAIQVIPEAILIDQDLQTLSSAVENVSSVVAPKSTELLTSDFIVRGFKSQFYLDAMPAFGSANIADPLSLVNVERIEVAKGPSATLFGGGLGAPIGGLINVVSKSPMPESKYSLSLRGGSFATINPSFDFNQPLTSDDKVLFRLTGEYEHSESFIDELKNEQYSIFPTLSVDFSEDTRLILRGQYSRIKFLEYAGLRAEGTIAPAIDANDKSGNTLANPSYSIPRFRYSGATDTPDSVVENKMLTLEFSHRFSSHVKASINARYFENDFEENSSFSHRLFIEQSPRGSNLKPSEFPFFSGILDSSVQEFVINPNIIFDFDTGPFIHKVLAGAEYDKTNTNAKLGISQYNFRADMFLDVADRNDDIHYSEIVPGNIQQSQDNSYQTIGVYIQDQIDLTDRLHFLAAIRWTTIELEERKSNGDPTTVTNNDKFTPRVGATFDITDEVSIFAGYGEGFRAVLALFGETAKPELSNQIEGGFKFDFADLGMSGTLSGYQLIRENVAVPDPEGAFSSIQAGEQTAIGGELDLMWEPTESLAILGNYAYTDATLTKHSQPELGVGHRLPRVPQHSGRAAIRYRFQDGLLEGLSLGTGVTLSSSRHIQLPNTHKTNGFYRVDAQASYPLTENLQLTVNIQNLTNSKYYEPFLFLEDSVVAPGQPIAAFATLKATF